MIRDCFYSIIFLIISEGGGGVYCIMIGFTNTPSNQKSAVTNDKDRITYFDYLDGFITKYSDNWEEGVRLLQDCCKNFMHF